MNHILTINGGSSSIKFALYDEKLNKTLDGSIVRIGLHNATLQIKTPEFTKNTPLDITDIHRAVQILSDWIQSCPWHKTLIGVGHRVVHGGAHHEAQRITPVLIKNLTQLIPLDPEHLPMEILLIQTLQTALPVLHIACFDTAFHHNLPNKARMIAIPRHYAAQGIRRYGFHGLSYHFLMDALNQLIGSRAKGRVILAHLGNGASLCAVHEGKSIDTSMGFTPNSGLIMGRRSGDLDPGLASYMAIAHNISLEAFNSLVNTQSGLLGLSQISADLQDLLDVESTDKNAAQAIELFCYQVTKWIGAFAAALGGLDTLVFSAGIGENAPSIRARITQGLGFLGITIDPENNARNQPIISTPSSPVEVRVIHTDENLMIAKIVHAHKDPNL